jgi:hypothetical protein
MLLQIFCNINKLLFFTLAIYEDEQRRNISTTGIIKINRTTERTFFVETEYLCRWVTATGSLTDYSIPFSLSSRRGTSSTHQILLHVSGPTVRSANPHVNKS